MTSLINTLPEAAFSILILLLVVCLKLLITKLSPSQSLPVFQLYCQRLADKVNKESNSQNHRVIAGFIATVITFIPLVVILWLFEDFIALPWLWSAILLYFSFGPFTLNKTALQVAKSLTAHDKYQAKQLISPLVLRDIEQLSSLGICKTTIEVLLLKKLQLQFIVGFYFLIFGPLAAISFRLLIEMHYSWNIKQHQFQAFGKTINNIVGIFQWLPSRLFLFLLLLITINQSIVLFWRLVKQYFYTLNNSVVISYCAYSLGIKLGGVAMYNKHKVRRLSFNDQGRQPEPKHIVQAIKLTNLVMALAVGLLISTTIILVVFTVNNK